MPYGVLEELAQEGSIDFSKIGKKDIRLKTFKYYNQEGYSTFVWGLDAYTEPNHIVSNVTFEFYDNNGLVGILDTSDRSGYYNGTITNYISFNNIPSLSDKNKGK